MPLSNPFLFFSSLPFVSSLTINSHSCLVEGDAKEEILQPPEPQPVPPILTPSPPSAYPAVTTVWQDNDRYHPKPVVHSYTPPPPTDLNENYNKPGDTFKQIENCAAQIEPIEKKLERKLSIEIKKIPLQEGPKSFEVSPPDTNSALNRLPSNKVKSTPATDMEQTGKSVEAGCGQISVNSEVLQHSDATQEGKNSDVTLRPIQLPLKERAHAMWNMPSYECIPSFTKNSIDDTLYNDQCHSSKASGLPPEPSLIKDPSVNASPLSFTNPLHSDDSEPEEIDFGNTVPKNVTSVLTSAIVTATIQNETPSARKISPVSIAREHPPSTLNLAAEKCKYLVHVKEWISDHLIIFVGFMVITDY